MKAHPILLKHFLGYLLVVQLLLTSCMPAAQGATLNPGIQQQPSDDNAADQVYLPVVANNSSGNPEPTATPTNTPAPQLQLNPIGNQIAKLGVTLLLKLAANNPGGGTLTYSVAPLPLPLNAAFNPATGEFSFKPDIAQIGEYSLTFSVSNGSQSASETIKINVPQPPANGATTLSGRILDANEAAAGRDVPLVGATVRLMNSSTPLSTTTASDGSFHFTGMPEGEQYFEYDGSSASSSIATKGSYGAYRGQKVIVAHVDNPIERPIYIMKIDMAGKTDVDPTATTIVNNPNISVTLTIPPATVKDETGQNYDGDISVSPVPDEFTPSSLPNNLNPSRVLTIQPMGLTFQQPAPIRFPNTDGLTPGSEVDIWSMDHKLGKFFIAGKGKVSEDGQWIETIEGGIREASWHFPLPQPFDVDPNVPDGQADNTGCPGRQPISSILHLASGCLESSIQLPSYSILGATQQLEFAYFSEWAHPAPMLPFQATIPQGAAIPDVMQYQLSYFGGLSTNVADPVIWNKSTIIGGKAEPLRGSVSVSNPNLSTGIYNYSIRMTNQYGLSKVSSDINSTYLVVNESLSPIGAGWGIAGLQKLVISPNGSVLSINGGGSRELFRSAESVFPLDPNVLALFEFNEDVKDLSGNNRHATLLGGQYVETTLGYGLRIAPPDPVGINWSAYASLLKHPYTIEFILTPEETWNWRKLFSFSDTADGGWYYKHRGLQPYPYSVVGDGTMIENQLHYLAFVSTSASTMDIYFQGSYIGSTNSSFTAPPNEAIFFRDERNTGRGEQLSGVVEALRISQVGRTGAEIAKVQKNIENQMGVSVASGTYVSPDGDFSTLTRNTDNTYTRRMKDGTTYNFNADGLQTAMSDRNGNTTTYQYDSSQRLSKIIDPVGLETIFSYNGARLQSVKDPMGRTTTFTHNAAGDLTKVLFPDGSSKQFGYDDRHLMTSETDERGKQTTRVYDAFGRLVSANLPENVTRSTDYAQKVGLHFGTPGEPAPIVRPEAVKTTVTDGESRTTTYTFGPLQSIASISDPAGFKTTIQRNADGYPTQTSYPSGQLINQTFDASGNLKSINDPTVQGTTSFGYEPLFNQPQTIQDPFGNTTTISYDGKGNPTQIQSPLQRTLRMSYDSKGLPVVITDTLGTVANFSYNAKGNLSQLQWGSGGEARNASFTYTDHGYLQGMSDPLQRSFSYLYDDLGRLTRETLPGNRTVSYQYDAAGNLTSLTPPGRPAHLFEYDGLGMLTGYTPPTVNGLANPKTSYSYNKVQQLTRLSRPDGKNVNYSYDTGGRLTTIQFSRGSLGYSYSSSSGQLTSISAPDNVALNFQYQGDLLTGESWSGALNGTVQRSYDKGYRTASLSVNGVAIGYQYDADSTPTKAGDLNLSYQPTSGLLASSNLGTVNDSFGYNGFAELQSYSANTGATPLFQTSYARDALGRITTLTETITNTTVIYLYGYDTAGRLATVQRNGTQIASYSYDANGNRLTATDSSGTNSGTYDNQDRLLSYGNATYTYTANGELTSKKVTSAGTVTEPVEVTTYNYDEFGNLLSVKLPNNDTISYLVDGKDRRVGRKLNGVLQKGWLYEDQLRPVAELDNTGAVTSRFVYATRINVPDYMVKGGVTYRLILDHLGSIRLVVNSQTGEVVQRMDYDAWGVVTLDTNPGFQPFGFAGGLWDGQTGLVRFGARDYDARVGRWVSKDPIGFEGGEHNVFTYTMNEPTNLIDVDGEVWTFALGAVGFLGNIGYQMWQNNGNWQCVSLYEAAGWALMGSGAGALRGVIRGVGTEFSHWIPARFIRSSSKSYKSWLDNSFGNWLIKGKNPLNGSYVKPIRHFRHDPYRQLKGGQAAHGNKWHPAVQQLDRVPDLYKGIGGVGGGASIGSPAENCSCK